MQRKGLDSIIKDPEELKQYINEQMQEIRNELLENRKSDTTVAFVIGNLSFKASDIVQYFDECNKLFLGLGIAYELMHDIAGLANVVKDTKIKEIAYNVADKIYNSI
jgi:hypothetical protein